MLTLLFVAVLHCVVALAFTQGIDINDSVWLLLLCHVVWLGTVAVLSWRMGRSWGYQTVLGAAIAVLPALPVAHLLWHIVGSGDVAADASMLASAYAAHDWRMWLALAVAAYAAWCGAWRRDHRESTRPNPYVAAALGVVPGLGFTYIGRTGLALAVVFVPLLALLFVLSSLNSAVAASQFVWVVGAIFALQWLLSIVAAAVMATRQVHQPRLSHLLIFLGIASIAWLFTAKTHGFLTGKQIVVAPTTIATLQAGDWVVLDREAARRRPLQAGELVGLRDGEVMRVVAGPDQPVEWRAERLYVDGISQPVELLPDNQIAEYNGALRYVITPSVGQYQWPEGPGYVLLPDDRTRLEPQAETRYERSEIGGPATFVLFHARIDANAFAFDFSRRGVAISAPVAQVVDN